MTLRGAVLSDLARAGLAGGQATESADDSFGFATIPNRGVLVTNELIGQLVEDTGA